ncbi:hypothetical protein AAHA92_12701 [Salvia divinorum]|uniref:Uncharacterized protein n=1 Tax=Salvia divinorum TaxID=28513 RepID=A0ABD1HL66_SALDI
MFNHGNVVAIPSFATPPAPRRCVVADIASRRRHGSAADPGAAVLRCLGAVSAARHLPPSSSPTCREFRRRRCRHRPRTAPNSSSTVNVEADF